MTDGQFLLPGRLDPPQITSDQNNYAPTGIGTSTVLYLDSDAVRSLTGLNAEFLTGSGSKGRRMLILVNDGSFAIDLEGEDANSDARNRFGWSGTYSLQPGEAVWLLYDGTALRWRGAARSDLGGGGSTLPVDDATAVVKGSVDDTKEGRFEVDTNVPTGTTVALAFPAANGTIATLALTETLTNKTIDGGILQGCSIVSDGTLQGFYDQNGNEVLQVAGVPSAVNHCAFVNATTGNGPIFRPGTGGDSNVVLNLTGIGTRGVLMGRNPAAGITTIEECGGGTSNPAATTEGSRVFRTDLDEPFYYDSSRSKWLAYAKETYGWGHASNDLAASAGVRIWGLGTASSANGFNYNIPFDCTIVGWSYTRADSDASQWQVMVGGSSVIDISTSATSGSSNTVDVNLSAGDRLWVRVGSGASNPMDARSFILWTRRRAT